MDISVKFMEVLSELSGFMNFRTIKYSNTFHIVWQITTLIFSTEFTFENKISEFPPHHDRTEILKTDDDYCK